MVLRSEERNLEVRIGMNDQAATLGALIRGLRKERGWTLRELSEQVGIPLSTLAKVEQDKLSLTYDKLQQFTSRLGLTMAEFLARESSAPSRSPVLTARRSLTGDGNTVNVSTPNYDYEYLCADLREKRMVPIIGRIRAHSLDEFESLIRHEGEEFIYVLEGAIEVFLEFYTPLILRAGQGVYIDSTMGHAYLAKDCESATVLAVCSSEDPDLASHLISLTEGEAETVA
jgi:transcriptional regulator with XRE-family HTH domain